MPRRRRSRYVPPPSSYSAEQLAAMDEQGRAEVERQRASEAALVAKTAQREQAVQFGEVLDVRGKMGNGVTHIWYEQMPPERLAEQAKVESTGPTREARKLGRDIADGTWQIGHWPEADALGGAKCQADIDKLWTEGWPEGAARAMKLRDELGMDIPPAQSTRRRREVGKDGNDVVVEAWIDRDIDHLFEKRIKVTSQGHKIIQIAVGWGGNAGRSGTDLFWAGAAALVLTEQLEAAGYGVEVHAYSWIRTSWGSPDHEQNKATLLDVIVKPSDQMLAADTFAAVLAHAGVWRSYALQRLGHAPWNFGHGLGRTEQIDIVASDLVELGIIPEIEILLPNVYSKEAALSAIRTGLQDIADKYGEVV